MMPRLLSSPGGEEALIARVMEGRAEDRGDIHVMVAEVAERLEADLDVLAKGIEHRVTARVQTIQLAQSAALQDALRRGLHVGAKDALARLRSDGDVADELPADLVRLARLRGDRRFDTPHLAELWLVGQEAFWDCFAIVAERVLNDAGLCWDVVKAARRQLSGRGARSYELFRAALRDEFSSVRGLNDGSQWEGVSRALHGQQVDAEELGYNLANSHIALIADRSSVLDALAHRTGRELLQIPAPGGEVWGWLGGRPQLPDADLDELAAWQRSRDGCVAIGEPAEGIAGFLGSHEQALEARGIATAIGERVVRFADVRLLIAVLRDGELAKEFVERELGELNHPSKRVGELRATVRVYLEHGQSVSATAALRHRDRRTIQRQLRSAERLVHRYVNDRCDELLVALRAADILRYRQQTASPSLARWL